MKARLVFTTHALRRMHGIRSEQVRAVLERGERIEEYPDDTPFPSRLMLGGRVGCCTWWPRTTPRPTKPS